MLCTDLTGSCSLAQGLCVLSQDLPRTLMSLLSTSRRMAKCAVGPPGRWTTSIPLTCLWFSLNTTTSVKSLSVAYLTIFLMAKPWSMGQGCWHMAWHAPNCCGLHAAQLGPQSWRREGAQFLAAPRQKASKQSTGSLRPAAVVQSSIA